MPRIFLYMRKSYNKYIGVIDLNHAFVFAAQQFLGFELCDALLENGWTVTAIDENKEMKDKWLEIGRNSNIQYVPYEDWDKEIQSGCSVFLPYYDQLRENKVDYLPEVEGLISKFEQPLMIIRIYPNRAINQNHKEGTVFYLPTLYGIHQPNDFLFARLLTGEDDDCNYIDDPSGAIYVKDAARSIINHSSKKEVYTVKALSSQSWNEALSYLTKKSYSPPRMNAESDGKELIVKPSKSHDRILKEQLRGITLHEIQE
ncbi:hypothetical protein [Rossellomorea aquimaris]|uniref:hypothetical protein n=1 Tax=Rossellomorea aquimaris TaxID=189382 RepID=UPI00155A38A5|nr:hypothetical protein [Rossellomorea aquimaris]